MIEGGVVSRVKLDGVRIFSLHENHTNSYIGNTKTILIHLFFNYW
jgi:hypothetical protein